MGFNSLWIAPSTCAQNGHYRCRHHRLINLFLKEKFVKLKRLLWSMDWRPTSDNLLNAQDYANSCLNSLRNLEIQLPLHCSQHQIHSLISNWRTLVNVFVASRWPLDVSLWTLLMTCSISVTSIGSWRRIEWSSMDSQIWKRMFCLKRFPLTLRWFPVRFGSSFFFLQDRSLSCCWVFLNTTLEINKCFWLQLPSFLLVTSRHDFHENEFAFRCLRKILLGLRKHSILLVET